MTEKQSQLAILFADISGSTSLYERLGDVEAKQQVAACLEAIIDQVEIHRGRVINTIGDEVLCTFADASVAAEAAMDMQETFDVTVHQKPDKRVGMAIR
ncbi:MAG: adenylate/guanylate cyclase domain-containing protein, partial [Gammaproteobacteria bacterium]